MASATSRLLKAMKRRDHVYTKAELLPGPSPTPRQCEKAVKSAARCETLGCSEAAWNSGVHHYLLDLALDTEAFTDRVDFINWYYLPTSQPTPALNANLYS